ncbi:rhomboid family intramembrane serine protease GlpG [Thalassotalea sp. PLHSN55]|uniref:rhomboid family intramembrane serine protease GlpG n=1 Tax=Thalassotalea sp. PLHSN55 TaxID=3435888 RepID=UPI003F82F63D
MNNISLQPLVKVGQHNIALIFADYLQSINIEAKTETIDGEFIVYCDSDKIDQAKDEFEQFIAQPYHEKYQQAAWQHGQVNEVTQHTPSLLTSFKKQFLAHAGIVTLVIFSACWLVFIASMLGWGNSLFHALQFYPHFSMSSFLSEPLRILGPAIFHFSWLHIVFNTMWWWQLGGNIENKLGAKTLLLIFVFSAIVSNVGQYLVSGPNFGGLSGVVYALVGYVWWMQWLRPQVGLTITKPIVGILLLWMMLGFAELLPVNMANTAHLLGLVSGCLLAWLTTLQLAQNNR